MNGYRYQLHGAQDFFLTVMEVCWCVFKDAQIPIVVQFTDPAA